VPSTTKTKRGRQIECRNQPDQIQNSSGSELADREPAIAPNAPIGAAFMTMAMTPNTPCARRQ